MQLSNKAIKDLRVALDSSYGEGFSNQLNDEEINHLGVFFLTCLVEGFKLEMKKKD